MNSTIPKSLQVAAKVMLVGDEGIKFQVYKDTKNFWTIGVGRYIGENLADLRLSYNTVMQMLDEDVDKHYREACTIFGQEWFDSQAIGRQLAILTLVFTMGRDTLLSFHQTVPAIRREKWAEAALLLRRSKWAADVDPLKREGIGRDDRICYMLETGEIHADYKINI